MGLRTPAKRTALVLLRASRRWRPVPLALLGQTRVVVNDGIEDRAIEAVDLLVYLAPLDAHRLRVCDQLVREFVNRDDVCLRGLGDVVKPAIDAGS